MKRILIFVVPLLFSINVFAQNTNPYSIFGYHSEVEYKLPMDKLFRIHNADTLSPIKAITVDFEGSLLYFLGEYDVILDTMNVNPDDVLIWLSVDPLAHKYPHLSPYSFCANNPIIYRDPDGRDIWTIHEDGTINRQKDRKIDRIDVIDANGNTIKGTEARYGTIKQHTLKGEKGKMDYFEIRGDDLAKEAFENIANNTTIEWTHAKVGTKNSGSNIVGTSHSKNSTAVGGFLRETGYTLREVNHNHPSGSPFPSYPDPNRNGSDIEGAQAYQAKFPNINLNIYLKEGSKYGYQKGYYSYDKYGATWGVQVTPK